MGKVRNVKHRSTGAVIKALRDWVEKNPPKEPLEELEQQQKQKRERCNEIKEKLRVCKDRTSPALRELWAEEARLEAHLTMINIKIEVLKKEEKNV